MAGSRVRKLSPQNKHTHVVLSSADSCRNIHIYAGYIPTQWIIDAGRLLYKNIYLALYCKGSKRVTQGLRVRGSWISNITAIFWPPNLWLSMLCLSASYQHLLWSPNSIGVPEGPFGRVWLSLPHLVYLCLQLYCYSTGSSNSTELYNRSTPTRSLKSNV